jgi:ABC-type multidrug transport system fused ATPase/permease subunit
MELQGKKFTDRINIKDNLRIYFGFLARHKLLAAGVLLAVLVNEALFISERVLFKLVVDNGTFFEAGTIAATALRSVLFIVGGLFLLVIVGRVIAKWFFLQWLNRLDAILIFDLKNFYFSHIVSLSHSFHTSNKTGSMISRLIRGAGAIDNLTDRAVFDVIPLVVRLAFVGGSIALFDPVTAVIAVMTVVVFIGYSYSINKLQQKDNMAFNDQEDLEKGRIADVFTNIDSIKYFGKEQAVSSEYRRTSDLTRKKALLHWDWFRWIDSGHQLILGVGTGLLVGVPLYQMLNGTMTLGTLVFIYTTFLGLMNPMFGFVNTIRQFYKVMADFESLFQYGRVEQEVKDAPHAVALKVRRGAIEFHDVTFKYKKRVVLSGFTLHIRPNTKVALVGPSGAGKSTIVKLLYRFYDVNEGGICIDGIDIRNVKQESLRSQLSIVPQECVLFDDTIHNNIKFSNPSASPREVAAAMRFAQLDRFVKQLPLKDKTIVGERGVKLSGGEKQRVSIARALLADKKILVLDEATSSLDSETEAEIQRELQSLMQGRTTLIIAHRLSTIMSADLIVVVEKGRIVQQGTHNELIGRPGLYAKLWSLQKGGYLGR